jgi:CRISPR-associated protein Cas5t
MQCFCVEIATQTTSFRNPEFQNFHKTLDMPPPSTIIGFAGAAMGLSPKMAQAFFDDTPFVTGVSAVHSGRTTDTWKYRNQTKDMHLYDPLKDGSVIKRELLIRSKYSLVFGSENTEQLESLFKAIAYPKFALTLGSSDSVVWVKRMQKEVPLTRSNLVKDCLVSGDIVGEVIRRASDEPEFSIYQTSEPITYDLPVRFNYKSDYGRREVEKTKTLSIITQEMQLNFEVEGVLYDDHFIPVFDL